MATRYRSIYLLVNVILYLRLQGGFTIGLNRCHLTSDMGMFSAFYSIPSPTCFNRHTLPQHPKANEGENKGERNISAGAYITGGEKRSRRHPTTPTTPDPSSTPSGYQSTAGDPPSPS